MKVHRLFPLLFLTVFGFGLILYGRFFEPDDKTGQTNGSEDSGPATEINFPLLDQVRPLDLIEMELDFPESLKNLEGRTVSLVGFMAPFDSLHDMRRCMIVPSYVGCTFCSPPSLTQVVYISQADDGDNERPFIEEASHVIGTLRLSLPGSQHEGKQQGFLYTLENAIVTPHSENAPERAPGHDTAEAHQQSGAPLAPVRMEDLIQEVSDLLGRDPLSPIQIETVSSQAFGDLLRDQLKQSFPEGDHTARAKAFSLIGMPSGSADWIETIAAIQLTRRVAITEAEGKRISLLDTVSENHPYVRLKLVGEIAIALTKQHFPHQKKHKDGDSRRAFEALEHGIRVVTINRYARALGIPPEVQPPAELNRQSEERKLTPEPPDTLPQYLQKTGANGLNEGTDPNESARRSFEALQQGLRAVKIERSAQPLTPFTPPSAEFRNWQFLPSEIGPFFVDFHTGSNGPLSAIDPLLAKPPSTTIELFRPKWYQDSSLWHHDSVPSDFADQLLDTPPILTDVLGIGGLLPWFTKLYSVDVAKDLSGRWAGDRWAYWQLDDDTSALLLETRWQDENSALRFIQTIPDHPSQRIAKYEPGSRTVRLIRANSSSALRRLASALAGPQTP